MVVDRLSIICHSVACLLGIEEEIVQSLIKLGVIKLGVAFLFFGKHHNFLHVTDPAGMGYIFALLF